ncbi:MAG TPA: translation initiation factor IF-1 [Polyangiaceae bacterium]
MIECEGVVTDVGRGDLYSIEAAMGSARRKVLARRSGKLTKFNIKIVSGDRVLVEVSPYDLGRGRITRRL